ncbi:MAG: hypothetical protein ACREJQ_01455 [bacterium]
MTSAPVLIGKFDPLELAPRGWQDYSQWLEEEYDRLSQRFSYERKAVQWFYVVLGFWGIAAYIYHGTYPETDSFSTFAYVMVFVGVGGIIARALEYFKVKSFVRDW